MLIEDQEVSKDFRDFLDFRDLKDLKDLKEEELPFNHVATNPIGTSSDFVARPLVLSDFAARAPDKQEESTSPEIKVNPLVDIRNLLKEINIQDFTRAKEEWLAALHDQSSVRSNREHNKEIEDQQYKTPQKANSSSSTNKEPYNYYQYLYSLIGDEFTELDLEEYLLLVDDDEFAQIIKPFEIVNGQSHTSKV